MFDVLRSAALYTVYAAVVAATLQIVGTAFHVGGAAATEALRFAATALSIG